MIIISTSTTTVRILNSLAVSSNDGHQLEVAKRHRYWEKEKSDILQYIIISSTCVSFADRSSPRLPYLVSSFLFQHVDEQQHKSIQSRAANRHNGRYHQAIPLDVDFFGRQRCDLCRQFHPSHRSCQDSRASVSRWRHPNDCQYYAKRRFFCVLERSPLGLLSGR